MAPRGPVQVKIRGRLDEPLGDAGGRRPLKSGGKMVAREGPDANRLQSSEIRHLRLRDSCCLYHYFVPLSNIRLDQITSTLTAADLILCLHNALQWRPPVPEEGATPKMS